MKLSDRLLVPVGVQLSVFTAFELFETRLEGILRYGVWNSGLGEGRDGVAGFFPFPSIALDPVVYY